MLKLISKYRTELMGFATIWVMLFHFKSELHDSPLYYFSSIGYGGVDIFLFLSGFGLFCGFDKNNSIKRFYLKRFIRIYPLYLFIIIVASTLVQEYNPILIFVKSLGIGYYLQFITNDYWYEWYIPTILLFYLLFPFIYKKLKINILKWGGVMIGLGLFLTAILVIIQKGTVILSTSRFPIFIIGCMAGYAFINKIELKRTAVICSISLLFMILQIFLVNSLDRIFLWRNGISWLPFIVITPGLCFLLCYIFDKINLKSSNLLALMGKLSLEAYLVHVICLRYLKNWYGSIIEGSTIKLWISFMLFFLLTLAISYILHRAFDKLKLIIKI